MFQPTYTITPELAKLLMAIDSQREAMADIPLTSGAVTALRASARLVSTHYSTKIEGNQLTQAEVEKVLAGSKMAERERDQREVKNHHRAQDFIDKLIREPSPAQPVSEKDIKTIHGLVWTGRKTPTPYRDGQNVIKDSRSGKIVYMPPEAQDVGALMAELVSFINQEIAKDAVPAPIIAAIGHYQFATIHPYYDGNGRTARLLTTSILHRCHYGLKGIYSLDEYYADNLSGYYSALSVGPSHNYYGGRAQADITPWLLYFCAGMASAFAAVRQTAQRYADREPSPAKAKEHEQRLRELDSRQRQVLTLFKRQRYATTREIAALLGVHQRTALSYCAAWCAEGFLNRLGTAPKNRKYELTAPWEAIL